jgi:hypothetical protein
MASRRYAQDEAAERADKLAEIAQTFFDIAERLDELSTARVTRWTKPVLTSHNLGVVKRRAALIKKRLGMKD